MVSRVARRFEKTGQTARCWRDGWCMPYMVGRGLDLRPKSRRCAAVGHLRAKSRALRPGCAPKRRCGASTKRACGRSPRRQAACSFTVGMALPLVCRGRMHAARHVCFTIPFFGCDGVWSMRRGGIHAAREHCGHCPLPGRLLFVLPCRAGDFARRTDNFFNFYNVRRA